MKYAPVLPSLVLALCQGLSAPEASAAVTFTPLFEPGSKWYTEAWSGQARAEMEDFLADVGALFSGNGNVVIRVTDDENRPGYAATSGPVWWDLTTVDGLPGKYSVPSIWSIIVRGVDKNGGDADANINWNLNADQVSGGNVQLMIGNIHGLGRHEMHHSFGCISSIGHSDTVDPRGTTQPANLMDALYRDMNGAPLLGAFNPANNRFTVNNYAMDANWLNSKQSGLYFEGRNKRGQAVTMANFVINQPGFKMIDFSHLNGIAYSSDHPSWHNYEETDLSFLRAMGYPLAADAALAERANVTAFNLTGSSAELTCDTNSARFYRVMASSDLNRWFLRPAGQQGNGGSMVLSVPSPAAQARQFYQVVEVP